jgi:hypothetical protein
MPTKTIRNVQRTQLNVWIEKDIHDALNEQRQKEGRSLTDVVEDHLVAGIARYRGVMVEQQSLPVIREIVQTELRRAVAQLRMEVREDLQQELGQTTGAINAAARRNTDRLAGLVVIAIKEAGIAQRLVYATLYNVVVELLRKPASVVVELQEKAVQQIGRKLADRGGGDS